MTINMSMDELDKLAAKTDAAKKRVMELKAQLAAAEADLKEVADVFNEQVFGASPEKERHSSAMKVVCPACREIHGAEACYCGNCGTKISSTSMTYVREAIYEEHYLVNIPDTVPGEKAEAYVLESLDIMNSDPTTTKFSKYHGKSWFEQS